MEAVARRVQELAEQGHADPAMVAVAELTNDDEQKHRMGKEAYMVQKLSRLTLRALTVKLCDTLSNISDSPTPKQAATYAAIQRRLQAAPPAAWDSLHAQLSAAIIKEYEARFETPNN